jgi:hypothetical protein
LPLGVPLSPAARANSGSGIMASSRSGIPMALAYITLLEMPNLRNAKTGVC